MWKYTDSSNLVASRVNTDGSCESKLVSAIVLDTGETILPADPTIPQPDGLGFAQAVKAGVGGILVANTLALKYPLFFDAVSLGAWSDVQALILDAQATGVLNTTQYAEFKAAVLAFNIPIVLP